MVVNLILDMRRAGHPYFAQIDVAEVHLRAATLPENGVPPEVLTIITTLDDSHDKLSPQKAAAPTDGLRAISSAGAQFAAQRPRAAVPEGQSNQDATQSCKAALKDLSDALATDTSKHKDESLRTLEVRTGNNLMDQFQQAYFAIAFCFCFQYATAFPDVSNTTQQHLADTEKQIMRRRKEDAPEISIHAWASAMQRRIEAQFRRDWSFGFTLWNYLFRTMVNLQKNATFMQFQMLRQVTSILTLQRASVNLPRRSTRANLRTSAGQRRKWLGISQSFAMCRTCRSARKKC